MAGRFSLHAQLPAQQSPRPARRRGGDALASRGLGQSPSGSPEGSALWRPPRRRPLRRGVPAAQAAPPARSADSTLARWTKGSGFFNRGLSLPPILRVSPEKPYLTACKKGRNILYCFHIHRGAETGYTAPSAPAASAKGLYRNNLRPWPAHLAATPYYFCTVPNDFRS